MTQGWWGIQIQWTLTEWPLGARHKAGSSHRDIYYSHHHCVVVVLLFSGFLWPHSWRLSKTGWKLLSDDEVDKLIDCRNSKKLSLPSWGWWPTTHIPSFILCMNKAVSQSYKLRSFPSKTSKGYGCSIFKITQCGHITRPTVVRRALLGEVRKRDNITVYQLSGA